MRRSQWGVLRPISFQLLLGVMILGPFGAEALAQQQSAARQRQFAPGVMITIPPEIEPEETVSTHDIVEIRSDNRLKWKPEYIADSRTLYGLSHELKFRRDTWCLKFSFKPVRMIEVDIPQPSGQMRRTLVWYLVYKVENTGSVLAPSHPDDESFKALPGKAEPIRFIPHMVLEAQDRDASGQLVYKAYFDSIIPIAVEAIQRRETPGRRLLNSAQMAEEILPPSPGRDDGGVWGVATWEGLDPRIDFFSIFVSGLSNAYRWVDPPGAYKVGDPPGKGRRFARKRLQLNFWRPGDELLEHEEEIRFGVPKGKAHLYDIPEGVAYKWIYR